MTAAVFFFAESANPALRLAGLLDLPCQPVTVRQFPDGESLVRVPATGSASTAILYRSLNRPNEKLVELLLTASALRDIGARRVILVAPYMSYMRQDKAFHSGEAVSFKVIGTLLSQTFDAVFTVDPHLHRIKDLGQVIPGIPAIGLTAAPILAAAINAEDNPLLVGPDRESRQWVQSLGDLLGLEVLIGSKQRSGDRNVAITIAGLERAKRRRAILVDDLISSGTTCEVAASLLKQAGASTIEAFTTHCLASEEDLLRLKRAGIDRICSTDTIESPCARLSVAPVLASALRDSGELDL